MVAGKSQIAAAAVVLAVAGSAFASPTYNKLVARGNDASTDTGTDQSQNTATDRVTDTINNHINSQQRHHHVDPKLSAALAKAAGPHDPALVEAAVKAHKFGGKKRDVEDKLDQIFARSARRSHLGEDMTHSATTGHRGSGVHGGHQHGDRRKREVEDELDQIFARAAKAAGAAAEFAKGLAHNAVTGHMTGAINNHIGQQQKYPQLPAALGKVTGPYNPAAVSAVVQGHQQGGRRKREVEDELDQIFARAAKAAGAAAEFAKGLAHNAVTGHMTGAINNHVGQQQKYPQLPAALAKVTGPHNPAAVSAVVQGHQQGGRRKRDVEDELDQIFARAAKAAGAAAEFAKGLAHSAVTGHMTGAINNHVGQQQQYPQLPAALAKVTGPHNPAVVSAVVQGHQHGGRKKRDLEDELYELFARAFDFELDDLE